MCALHRDRPGGAGRQAVLDRVPCAAPASTRAIRTRAPGGRPWTGRAPETAPPRTRAARRPHARPPGRPGCATEMPTPDSAPCTDAPARGPGPSSPHLHRRQSRRPYRRLGAKRLLLSRGQGLKIEPRYGAGRPSAPARPNPPGRGPLPSVREHARSAPCPAVASRVRAPRARSRAGRTQAPPRGWGRR